MHLQRFEGREMNTRNKLKRYNYVLSRYKTIRIYQRVLMSLIKAEEVSSNEGTEVSEIKQEDILIATQRILNEFSQHFDLLLEENI